MTPTQWDKWNKIWTHRQVHNTFYFPSKHFRSLAHHAADRSHLPECTLSDNNPNTGSDVIQMSSSTVCTKHGNITLFHCYYFIETQISIILITLLYVSHWSFLRWSRLNGLLTVLSLLIRWKQRCTWSTPRRWDLCCQCSSASCTAARAPLPSEQTSGSASGPMTPQEIRLRRMFIWGWGCTRRWALYKVRVTIEQYMKHWVILKLNTVHLCIYCCIWTVW